MTWYILDTYLLGIIKNSAPETVFQRLQDKVHVQRTL